jgi:LysM repeat protein
MWYPLLRFIIPLTLLIASTNPMKSFKKFLIEQQATQSAEVDHVKPLYYSLVSAEHRGVVKDPKKFDPKLYIRTKYQPKNDISTAYGPAQLTVSTIEDAVKRHPQNFSEDLQPYIKKFVEQGNKMKAADPKDPKYGYGCKGDLCSEEYAKEYERTAIGVLKSKMDDAKIDYSKPIDGESLTKATTRWRGVEETDTVNKKGKTVKGDPDYFKIVRDRMKEYTQPSQPKQEPQPEAAPVKPAEPKAPEQQSDGEDYVVKPGDSFWKIGGSTQKGMEGVQAANPNVDPMKLKPGQTIRVPRQK